MPSCARLGLVLLQMHAHCRPAAHGLDFSCPGICGIDPNPLIPTRQHADSMTRYCPTRPRTHAHECIRRHTTLAEPAGACAIGPRPEPHGLEQNRNGPPEIAADMCMCIFPPFSTQSPAAGGSEARELGDCICACDATSRSFRDSLHPSLCMAGPTPCL